jgi:hypothetical protein
MALPFDDSSHTCGPHFQRIGLRKKRRLRDRRTRPHPRTWGRPLSLRAIIGNPPRDGESRSAIGAVEERVSKAAVSGIE